MERFRSAQIEAGKTTDIGEIKAQQGLLLRARVVGADTKAPLPDARFRIGYNAVINVVGADGVLQSRVAPPQARGGFDQPKIESEGYVDYDLPLATFKATDGIADLGTIEMQRGNAIVGTIRLEGVPDGTKAPSISFSRENNYDFVNPQDDGSFASKTLAAGSYSVNMNGGGDNWQIVSPRTVSLPEAGVEFKPIEIVIKRLTPVLPIIKSARGRVLDENGQGVAGVTVNATMALENGNTYPNRSATTDEKGDFILPGEDGVIRIEIEGAQHPNYVVGGATKVEVADGIATISGLVAKKRGSVYRSHVADAQGKPAKKRVGRRRRSARLRAGANRRKRRFRVARRAALAVHFNRGAGTRLGETIGAKRPAGRAAAIAIIGNCRESGAGARCDDENSNGRFVGQTLRGLGRVGRRGRRTISAAQRRASRADVMALFGGELARRDPAQLLKRAPELLGNSTGEARENLEAQLNLVRAQSDDATAAHRRERVAR